VTLRFGDLGLKITVTVSWFGPQNQEGYGLSIVPQNRWEEDDVGHVSTSSGLLCLEASRARVSQFCLKIGGVATAGGARGIISEIAWK
jgi:glycerate kinase